MPKRLILCCDGTWNRPDELDDGHPAPTNVSKLANAILPADVNLVPQVIYYHTGVGSDGDVIDHVAGGAFGVGIDRIMEDCYRFLVQNFVADDELWFFGFSRGAYIARTLVGLIHNSGLLWPAGMDRFEEAMALYRRADAASRPDGAEAIAFRSQYSRETAIHFLGVWDTVGTLGIPMHVLPFLESAVEIVDSRVSKYQFHDNMLSATVKNAFHAVAVDEQRKPFAPSLWENEPAPGQTLEQVWFAGVHSNVGGGYDDHGLSDITLRWMIDQAKTHGLEVGDATLAPNPCGVLRDSLTSFYKIFGRLQRTIRPGVAGQRIDSSVHTRMTECGVDYQPPNVLAAG